MGVRLNRGMRADEDAQLIVRGLRPFRTWNPVAPSEDSTSGNEKPAAAIPQDALP